MDCDNNHLGYENQTDKHCVQSMVSTIETVLEKMFIENDVKPILIAGDSKVGNSLLAETLNALGNNTELINVPHAQSLGIYPEKLIHDLKQTYLLQEVDGVLGLQEASLQHVMAGGFIILFICLKNELDIKLALSKGFRVLSLTQERGLTHYIQIT